MINHGDIHFIELTSGRCSPAVILSEHEGYASVVYLSSHPDSLSHLHVQVESTGRTCYALCDRIFSVSSDKIKNQIASCDQSELEEIDEAVSEALCISTKPKTIVRPKPVEPVYNRNEDLIRERDLYKDLYEYLLRRRVAGE